MVGCFVNVTKANPLPHRYRPSTTTPDPQSHTSLHLVRAWQRRSNPTQRNPAPPIPATATSPPFFHHPKHTQHGPNNQSTQTKQLQPTNTNQHHHTNLPTHTPPHQYPKDTAHQPIHHFPHHTSRHQSTQNQTACSTTPHLTSTVPFWFLSLFFLLRRLRSSSWVCRKIVHLSLLPFPSSSPSFFSAPPYPPPDASWSLIRYPHNNSSHLLHPSSSRFLPRLGPLSAHLLGGTLITHSFAQSVTHDAKSSGGHWRHFRFQWAICGVVLSFLFGIC